MAEPEIAPDVAATLKSLQHCVDKPMRNIETFPTISRQAIDVIQRLVAARAPDPSRDGVVEALRAAISTLIHCWESLPEGHYSPQTVERWLIDIMAPAVNHARAALSASDGPAP